MKDRIHSLHPYFISEVLVFSWIVLLLIVQPCKAKVSLYSYYLFSLQRIFCHWITCNIPVVVTSSRLLECWMLYCDGQYSANSQRDVLLACEREFRCRHHDETKLEHGQWEGSERPIRGKGEGGIRQEGTTTTRLSFFGWLLPEAIPAALTHQLWWKCAHKLISSETFSSFVDAKNDELEKYESIEIKLDSYVRVTNMSIENGRRRWNES